MDKMDISEIVQNTIAELDEFKTTSKNEKDSKTFYKKDIDFIKDLKERIDVLFIGLQSEGIKNIEDKLEITLEYLKSLSKELEKRLKEADV